MSIEDYEPVASRLVRFWAAHPDGRVITSLVTYEGDRVIAQADIYLDREDNRPVARSYAEELRGSNNVNRTSHIENACTSAVGRALADCGFASDNGDYTKRPSREEMSKVERMQGNTRISEPANKITDKQIGMIKAICKSMGKLAPSDVGGMTKFEASAYIDKLKAEQAGEAPAPLDEEEVF